MKLLECIKYLQSRFKPRMVTPFRNNFKRPAVFAAVSLQFDILISSRLLTTASSWSRTEITDLRRNSHLFIQMGLMVVDESYMLAALSKICLNFPDRLYSTPSLLTTDRASRMKGKASTVLSVARFAQCAAQWKKMERGY